MTREQRAGWAIIVAFLGIIIVGLLSSCGEVGSTGSILRHADDPEAGVRCYRWGNSLGISCVRVRP